MPTVGELTFGPPKILIYGEVGCGKTALALTLGSRAQVIDMDNGLRTGLSIEDKFTQSRKQVDAKQFFELDPSSKATAFAAVKNYIYGLPAEIKAGRFKFDAIVLDTLSTFAESAVAYIMGNSGKLGQAPQIQHWGAAFIEIKNVLSVLRSLPIVFVMLAHEQVKSVGKGEEQEDKMEIAIQGKNLPSQICKFFDEIWYLRPRAIGGGKNAYVIQTIGTATFAARSRACIPNFTDTSIGMWDLLAKAGYKPPERKV